MMDVVLAVILPFLIMVIITRITFSLIGACIVTWMIMIFILQDQSIAMGIIAFLSFIGGLVVARTRLTKKPGM